jgi:hypothetical protein
MVSTQIALRSTQIETVRMRQQAHALLARLLSDREQSEQRQAETGRRDPLKFVTGRSALDNAIATTRELIVRLDELQATMNGQASSIEVAARVSTRLSRIRPKAIIRPVAASALS